jgi:hypothetical protein
VARRLLGGLLALAIGLVLADDALVGWLRWASDWIASRASAARQADDRLEPLATRGPQDAPMVLVAAWDPMQPASTATLRCLAAYQQDRFQQRHTQGVLQVRLVRLLDAETPAALAEALGALDGQDLLWPWLLGDTPPTQPLTVELVLAEAHKAGERAKALFSRSLQDSEVQLRARRELRMARGLGLGPGAVMVNGVARAAAEVCPRDQQWQGLLAQEQVLGRLLRKKPEVAAAHAQLQEDAHVAEAVRERYRGWVVDLRKVRGVMPHTSAPP